MTSTTDTSLVTFKAIVQFATSLEEIFGKRQRSLKLYVRLLNKTTLAHVKAIHKHIEAFRTFCISNRVSLESRESSRLTVNRISYSDRVYIDMKLIFAAADTETSEVIWRHLLTIAVLVDPTGKARSILNANVKNGSGETEANFLNNIIGKVEQHVDPNANPMEAVSSIMKSGVFSELVGGMGDGLQNGTLDLGKLMGTVQTMVSGLSMGMENAAPSSDSSPGDLIGTMMGSMNAGAQGKGGGSNAVPDLSGIMKMVGPMLNALQQTDGGGPGVLSGNGSIKEQIDTKTSEARMSGVLPTIKENEENGK